MPRLGLTAESPSSRPTASEEVITAFARIEGRPIGIVASAVFGIAYIPLIVLQVIAAVAGASDSNGGTAVAVVTGLLAAAYGILFFLATIPLASKLALFGVHYASVRFTVRRRILAARVAALPLAA